MISLIVGVICVMLGVYGLAREWVFCGNIRGIVMLGKALVASVPFLLVVGGVIAAIAGVSSLREQRATQEEIKESEEEEKKDK